MAAPAEGGGHYHRFHARLMTSNETQDQRPLASARVNRSERVLITKKEVHSGRRFALSIG